MYANVAVDFADSDRTRTYTYSIPDGLTVHEGDLVWVPFGHRPIQGIVMQVTGESAIADVRPIESVVDGGPFLSASHVGLTRWLSTYYRTSLFRSAELMLPPGTTSRLRIWVSRTPLAPSGDLSFDALRLTDEQLAVLDDVPPGKRVRRDRLSKSAASPRNRIIESLVRDGYLKSESAWEQPTGKPRFVKHIRLRDGVDIEDALERYGTRNAHRRIELTWALAEAVGPMLRADATRRFGAGVVKAVIDDGVAEELNVQSERDPLAHYATQENIEHDLTDDQAQCVGEIEDAIGASEESRGIGRFFLLHGVTGSGKTEVYLRAVRKCVELGKRAIVMVPEIAMTPQMLQRFASRFPGMVALQHSGLTQGQRYDQWHKIRTGQYDVVLGSRSSIFAPVGDLGLVVIDEEHEWTFKQGDRAPRYHARDVAERLCAANDAVLVVGSATPDVGTYHRSTTGATNLGTPYRRLELPHRVHRPPNVAQLAAKGGLRESEGALQHVRVSIVDMRQEFSTGRRELISRELHAAIDENIKLGRKVVLFINRRGSASFVQCASCGAVRKCPNCNTTLALHRSSRSGHGSRLLCHYCSYGISADRNCRACGRIGIGRNAAGTEGAEAAVRDAFPFTRIIRWDSDTARNAKEHTRILEQFQDAGPQILIGTQMVAKGLDIPTVGLVGVLSADTDLAVPSYRSPERTFQLIAQVVGRAGRSDAPGTAIVQTFHPESMVIARAAAQDYAGFYESEIAVRRNSGLPPFVRQAKLSYAHYSDEEARLIAYSVLARLEEWIASEQTAPITINGPTPTFPRRRGGRYRYNIFLTMDDVAGASFNPILDALGLGPSWTVELDPFDMS